MKRAPRLKQLDPRCEAVTPNMRLIRRLHEELRWRLTWTVKRGFREVRAEAFLMKDDGARAWCQRQGIAFPGDADASATPRPVPLAERGPISVQFDQQPPFTVVDVRALAAGNDKE